MFYENSEVSTNQQLVILSASLGVLWPTSAGRVSSKQCFMSRTQRMLYCEYILQVYMNGGSAAEQSSGPDIDVLFK